MHKLTGFSPLWTAAMLTLMLGCASGDKTEGTGEYFDDSVLTSKVIMEIFKDPALKSSEINVETFKGVVQLSGFVKSQSDINNAVHIAQNVKGVKQVNNDMRLK